MVKQCSLGNRQQIGGISTFRPLTVAGSVDELANSANPRLTVEGRA